MPQWQNPLRGLAWLSLAACVGCRSTMQVPDSPSETARLASDTPAREVAHLGAFCGRYAAYLLIDENERVTLNGDGTFVVESGSMGSYTRRWGGHIERRDIRLVLTPEWVAPEDLVVAPLAFYTVRWGERRYIVREQYLTKFYRESGSEAGPDRTWFFLHEADEQKPKSGEPRVVYESDAPA